MRPNETSWLTTENGASLGMWWNDSDGAFREAVYLIAEGQHDSLWVEPAHVRVYALPGPARFVYRHDPAHGLLYYAVSANAAFRRVSPLAVA